MLLVIGALLLMYVVLGFSTVGYFERELFACTVLYVFIFSLLIHHRLAVQLRALEICGRPDLRGAV